VEIMDGAGMWLWRLQVRPATKKGPLSILLNLLI